MTEERVALLVMRGQPISLGHTRLMLRAAEQCSQVALCLGSTQLSGVVRHPFTAEQRMNMIWAVMGAELMQRVRILPLQDINSLDDNDDWARYVLGKIAKQRMPPPTDYYTGSMADAKWYFSSFAGPNDEVTEDGDQITFRRGDKRLHIVDRAVSGLPQAEEVRSLIERRDPDWKQFVPDAIHAMIEEDYPAHLRVALRGTSFPMDPPEGLALIREDMDPPTRFEFRRGRWNKIRAQNASRFG